MWLGHPECKATWEPASNLPPTLISDFEAGIESEVSVKKASMYGYNSSLLHMSQKQSISQEQDPKKRKTDRMLVDDIEGFMHQTIIRVLLNYIVTYIVSNTRSFKEQGEVGPTCRTKKDRFIRLNDRTAGKAYMLKL